MFYVPCMSITATCLFVVILYANLMIRVENKSVFGIGTRIIGDQLLLKDILHTPPISLTEEPVIKFNYAITEPITYIEIESIKNVYAIVNFSYEDDLVEGTIISAMNKLQAGGKNKPEPFEVLIQIYGFNDTMLNVNPAYILNKDQQFNGVLKPKNKSNYQSLNLMQEDLNALDDLEDYNDEIDENDIEDDDDDDDDIDYEEEDFDDDYDKVIEQGQRQKGDFLVYETNQTSATSSEVPSNHSVTFYYIDIFYITYVKFTIFEHYLDNPLDNYVPPVVEYGHISPTTLKAVVTDYRTTSLFVQMQMYGFHPTELPVDYKPFLSNSQTSASVFAPATIRPISSLRQLQILMNAQQSKNTNIQQQQGQQQQSNELNHQISPSNNSHVNCLQQVLSSSLSSLSPTQSNNIANNSLNIFAHLAIFNLIATFFVTMIFV